MLALLIDTGAQRFTPICMFGFVNDTHVLTMGILLRYKSAKYCEWLFLSHGAGVKTFLINYCKFLRCGTTLSVPCIYTYLHLLVRYNKTFYKYAICTKRQFVYRY